VRRAEVPPELAAVAFETPLEAQLRWVKTAFPGRRRIVVLGAPQAVGLDASRMIGLGKEIGLELEPVAPRAPSEIVFALSDALRRDSRPALVLLLPDKDAFRTEMLGPLLQAALDARAPAIGFLATFLNMGAIAAVATDPRALALQAVELARSKKATVVPPAAHLVVDGRLAERLGIPVAGGPGIEVER
jgi:hypothetical protein